MKSIFSKLLKSIFRGIISLFISIVSIVVLVFGKVIKNPLVATILSFLVFIIWLLSMIGKDSTRMREMSRDKYDLSVRICRLMEDSANHSMSDTIYVVRNDTVYCIKTVYVTRFKYVNLDSL